jgi:hypothetical protein
MEKLNAESVFYWAWICSVCKGKRASFEVDAEKAEEYLDSLLPSLTELCEYTNQVIKHIEHIESEEDERLHLENLFIIEQLIKMFEYLDFSDVHGKKTLIKLCHALFSNKKYVTFFDTVMSVYILLIPSSKQRINKVIELISDVKDPHLKRAGEKVDAQPVQDPTECIIHCLNIAYCLLKDVSIVQITPQLEHLFDSLVIPNIESVTEDLSIMAVKVMSLILILKLEIAQKYIRLLLEMIKTKTKNVVIAGNF